MPELLSSSTAGCGKCSRCRTEFENRIHRQMYMVLIGGTHANLVLCVRNIEINKHKFMYIHISIYNTEMGILLGEK